MVATHDTEFAAEFATRAVLLAEGRVIADGAVAEVLARRLVLRDRDGADPRRRRGCPASRRKGAAAAWPRGRGRGPRADRRCSAVSWQLASFALVWVALVVAFWWYERTRPPAKLARRRRDARRARSARARRLRGRARRQADHRDRARRAASPSAPGPASPSVRSPRWPRTSCSGQGPWTPWQMLAWGLVGLSGAALASRSAARPSRLDDRARMRRRGRGLQPDRRPLHLDGRRQPLAGGLRRRARLALWFSISPMSSRASRSAWPSGAFCCACCCGCGAPARQLAGRPGDARRAAIGRAKALGGPRSMLVAVMVVGLSASVPSPGPGLPAPEDKRGPRRPLPGWHWPVRSHI